MGDYGIGDAYWYEWYVGLKFVLLMLYPNSKIEHVTLQASEVEGIDDVVVQYFNNCSMCIQVKHTRISDNLTFSNVFSGDSSWIKKMATGWKKKKQKGQKCIPLLYTNRELSDNSSSTYVSIQEFWSYIKPLVKKAKSLDELQVGKNMKNSWKKCLGELDGLDSDAERLSFLKEFTIVSKQPGLDEIKEKLMNNINKIFGIKNIYYTQQIFDSLCGALSTWSVSTRDNERIDKEEVYRKLSLPVNEESIDHHLPSPYPFFESRLTLLDVIKDKLLTRDYPVVFLMGEPGCGKSSIISELSNRKNSVIDLRYHAFKPILPETKELPPDYNYRVNSRRLWSDLLDQLRLRFNNRLAKFEVPIRNDFLSTEELRDHVLRLSEILYKEDKKVITIAIDGIDHAARASKNGNIEEVFLSYLVHPEKVPKGVCFLIAGQHPEGYPQYPIWLREKRSDVLNIEIPRINKQDVRQLFVKINPSFNNEQIESAVRVIDEISKGNTLSTVFAIHEASICNSIDDLEVILTRRKMHDGVLAYYKEIWEGAIRKIQCQTKTNIPYIGTKMAAYISLSSSLFEAGVLKNIYLESHLSEQDWMNILRDLRPLLIESEGGKFRLFHNDVRVYLMRELQLSPSVVTETASLIADFYLKSKEYKMARHIDLFNLLEISGRSSELIDLFSPEYVIESWSIRRPINEIVAQCIKVLQLAKVSRSWDKLYSVLESLKTVCQLTSTRHYANDINYFDKSEINIPAVLKSERKVLGSSESGIYHLEEVLKDANKLINAGLIDRACGLMNRWFKGSPEQILTSRVADYVSEKDGDVSYGKEKITFLQDWGKIIYYTGVNSELGYDAANKVNRTCLKEIFYGLLNQAITAENEMEFIRHFRKYMCLLDEKKIKSLLIRLAKLKKWREVGYILKKVNFENLATNNKIIYAFLALLCHNKYLVNKYVSQVINYEFEMIDYMLQEEEHYLFIMLCFINGWNECNKELMANKALKYYFSNRRDARTEECITNLFDTSIYLGWFYRNLFYKNNCLTEDGIKVMFSKIKLLYDIDKVKLVHTRNFTELRTALFKISTYCAKNSTEEAYSLFIKLIKVYMTENYTIHTEMEEIFEIFKENGEDLLIQNLFNMWIGKNGLVWKDEFYKNWISVDDLIWRNNVKRLRVAEDFIRLGEKFGLNKEVEDLKSTIGCNWIHCSIERVPLHDGIKWTSALLEAKPNRWEVEGLKLLEIARCISVGDDTILSIYKILSKASAKSGVRDFNKYLYSADIMQLDYFAKGINKFIYDGIIAILENGEFSKEELLYFWCTAIGGITWREREGRIYIEDIKKAILRSGYRLGYIDLHRELKEIAPLNFNVSQKIGRGNEYNWIHNNERKGHDIRVPSNEKLDKYTMNEIFNKFYSAYKENPVSRFTIVYANELVKRMKKQKTKDFKYYLEKLIYFVEEQNKKSYISWEEIGISFYQNLFDLLFYSSQDWVMIDIIFDDIKNDFNVQSEFSRLSKMIENVIFFRAQLLGENELIKGLQHNIKTLKQWTEGDKQLRNVKSIEVVDLNKTNDEMSWKNLGFELLLKNISCSSAVQIEVALQGLWQLIKLDNSLIKTFATKWGELSDSGKEWMMLFFERLVTEYPFLFNYIEPIVTERLASNHKLFTRVQAWIVLHAYKRISGQQNNDYLLLSEIKGFKRYLYTLLDKLPRINNDEFIPVIFSGFEGFPCLSLKLNQIQTVMRDQLSDIQIEVMQKLQDNVGDTNHNNSGDMRFFQNVEINILMEVLSEYIGKYDWLKRYNSVIAQAITYSEDPFILLQSPDFVYDKNTWFSEYSVSLVGKNAGTKLTRNRFIKHIKAGIKKDEIVICSQIYFFTYLCNYIFTYELEAIDGKKERKGDEMEYSLGVGRSYSFYVKERYECDNLLANKLFCKVTPIYQIPFSCAYMIPTVKFQKLFNLKASITNPFVFERKGEKVLWLEQYIGPIGIDEPYKQHTLQRWVCTKDFFSYIQRKLKNVAFNDAMETIPIQLDTRNLPDNFLIFN